MSNIFIKPKTCVLILVLFMRGVRAFTRMTDTQRVDGMKLLGRVFFNQDFSPEELGQFQDPLADYYSKLAVDVLETPKAENLLISTGLAALAPFSGNHSNKKKEKGIEVTALPDEIGWQFSFGDFEESRNGPEHRMKKLISSENLRQIPDALHAKAVNPSSIVGFGLDGICNEIDNTDIKEDSTAVEKEKLNAGSKGNLKPYLSRGECRLFVVVTTRRSETLAIYSSKPDNVTEDVANFTTRCANKAWLVQNFETNKMEDSEKFKLRDNKISLKDFPHLQARVQSAYDSIHRSRKPEKVVKSKSQIKYKANVILAWANVFVWQNNTPMPTGDIVVVLGHEGLSDAEIEELTQQLNFKEHNFQKYQPDHTTGVTCDICQKTFHNPLDQSNLPKECTDCGLFAHETCSRNVPKVFGLTLDPVGKGNVPIVLRNLITQIEKYGANTEGTYRVNGSAKLVQKLKSDFNSGMCISKDRIEKYAKERVLVLCDLAKEFIRELNPRLISSDVFTTLNDGLEKLSKGESKGDTIVTLLNRHLKVLPPNHKITLRFILEHLHEFANNAGTTKMNASSLSKVFAPNIIETGKDPLENTSPKNTLFEAMIKNFPSLDFGTD